MRPVLGIAIDAGRVWAVAVQRRRPVWAGEAGYSSAAELAEVLASLAANRPRGTRLATLALGTSIVTVKTIAGLPPLSAADLAAHVRLTSRRYFLQNGVPLVTNAAPVTARGKAPGLGLLAAAEAPLVEAAASGLAAAGLECRGIVPGSLLLEPDAGILSDAPGLRLAFAAATTSPLPMQLASDAERQASHERRRTLTRRMAAVSAVTLAVAGLTWIGGTAWRHRRAAAELARLRPNVVAALALRSDLDAATSALGRIAGEDARRSHAARVLADLAAALPDSAFATSLRLTSGQGAFAGYAPRAADAVRALERSGRFQRVAVDGPVTREAVAGRDRGAERFTVRFTWRP